MIKPLEKLDKEQVNNRIRQVLNELDRDRILERLSNNCVLASDMIQGMLHAYGIKSRCVEVTMFASRALDDGTRAVTVVGFDRETGNHSIDTHVVVVTQTTEPILIDASIGHLVRDSRSVLVAPVHEETLDGLICETTFTNLNVQYRVKRNVRLTTYHQKNIVERLKQEYELLHNVNWLKTAVIVSLAISGVNFLLNAILVLLKVTHL